jgi:tetratricopeptide (TPR) repeat protein
MALMIAHAEVGEFENAFAVERDSIKLAQAIKQPFAAALIYWAVGRAHAGKGDFDNAIAQFEVVERLTREWSLVLNRPYAVTALGYSYATVGRWDEALPLLVEGLESYRRGTPWHPHSCASWLAEGLLRLDRTEDAQRVATRLLELATETGARRDEALALRVLGDVYSRGECLEPGKAEEHYTQSLGLGTLLGMRPLTAHCHFGLAKLYRQTSKRNQARKHLTTASTMYRDMGMQFWLEQAEVEMRGLA